MGVISPVGNSLAEFRAALEEGRSGVGRITAFDAGAFEARIAGEVKDFDPLDWMDRGQARKSARFTQFALAAASQALSQAGLARPGGYGGDPARAAVVLGNGIGGFEVVTESFRRLIEGGHRRMLPLTVPLMIANEAAGNIAMRWGLRGPALTVVTACASGTDALGAALGLCRSSQADVVIAGGTEACIVPFAIGGFLMLKALSTSRNDQPEAASRPFDAGRDGFVMGEGAGVLVLEAEEHARRRGAAILAEFAGYGASCDAYHITAPAPGGEGGAAAIGAALADAGVAPQRISYYNAHGTGTRLNDAMETRMIKLAFGAHASELKISSTKSMTGHCIAGSGGLEAIACVLAIRGGFFPPTINLDAPDPECDLDYVPNAARRGEVEAAVSASLGFGGHNGAIVIRRYDDERN